MKFEIGDNTLDLGTPTVMAILNITPDSFWEESCKFSDGEVRKHIDSVYERGARLIDVGGYSSRPGAAMVSPEDELDRTRLGVKLVREMYPDVIISIDTFRASVASAIIDEFGPCMINDISAGEADPELVDVAAKYDVPYVAMHMRGTPADMQSHTEYADVAGEVFAYLRQRAEWLASKGVRKVILDPGFGFAKEAGQNYEVLSRLDELTAYNIPVLVGVSRKSMIYRALGLSPAEALAGTTALNWECLRKGARILRVHDVVPAFQTIKLYNFYCEHEKK